ncbi:unnamed protein product, partial [Scytosiphon promiscuus]
PSDVAGPAVEGLRVDGLCCPRCLDELLDCLVEHTEEDGRPILYFNDFTDAAAGGNLPLQDEWDTREMANRRLARRRSAEAQAEAEIRLWGSETDATGMAVAAVDGGAGGIAAGGCGSAAP